MRRRTVLGLGAAAGALALGGGAVAASYWRALSSIRADLAARPSAVVPTRHGDLEYAEAGQGAPLLMIHGTGGGFDQGLQFAARLPGLGYRVIAPSRFGYLRTSFPADASPEAQADAFVDLLDALGIGRIAVAGGSAGALSALAFAIRHPDRTAALLPIVPATYAPNRPPARPWSPTETRIATSVLQSDFLFWSAINAMPDTMIRTLLATDPALVHAASAEEQDRVRRILSGILPVSARAKGLVNDAGQAGDPQPMDLGAIAAPTLAISAEDDLYLTADAARHIAAGVGGARLIVYPDGGHVWVGHDADLFGAIDAFLREIGYS